ncbi:MAG: four helix bundle protein [Bacteroidetes bacterium]|nr:four helix bundle protein [Bacteroidota bacterium]
MKEKFVRSHQRLEAWNVSMDLVTELYRAVAKFPKYEQYGLSSQIRRAAVSVPANIAEGAARESAKEYLRFLTISRGSLSELETELLIAKRLEYIEGESKVFELLDKSSYLLNGLMKYIRSLIS